MQRKRDSILSAHLYHPQPSRGPAMKNAINTSMLFLFFFALMPQRDALSTLHFYPSTTRCFYGDISE
jgi:hypothetical protein